jgi:hypothetical protein
MTIDERLAEKFKALLEEGRGPLASHGWDGRKNHRDIASSTYLRFRTEALNLIRQACGEKSDHYQSLKQIAEDKSTNLNSWFYKDCFGIFEAAERDFRAGMLADIRSVVSAEVLDDLLEQAEHLFSHGYHIPAASLAGAVLEDALRRLAHARAIEIPQKTTIDGLNSTLAKAGVYEKATMKRITGIADVRNNADHGHFDKFKKDDVEDMLKWVRRFTSDYLS